MIRCPNCAAIEVAEAALFGGAPTIVCRNCGETWPAAETRHSAGPARLPKTARRPAEILEAERRPLVTFSQGVEHAWAAKAAADVTATPPRRSRLPGAFALLASIVFLAAFFGERERAVTALPDLAGLYAAVGLPVNLAGLSIQAVAAQRRPDAGGARLTVRGDIRNVTAGARPALPLSIAFLDAAGATLGARAFNAPPRQIAPGTAEPFMLELDGVPRKAVSIAVRFRAAAPAQLAARDDRARP